MFEHGLRFKSRKTLIIGIALFFAALMSVMYLTRLGLESDYQITMTFQPTYYGGGDYTFFDNTTMMIVHARVLKASSSTDLTFVVVQVFNETNEVVYQQYFAVQYGMPKLGISGLGDGYVYISMAVSSSTDDFQIILVQVNLLSSPVTITTAVDQTTATNTIKYTSSDIFVMPVLDVSGTQVVKHKVYIIGLAKSPPSATNTYCTWISRYEYTISTGSGIWTSLYYNSTTSSTYYSRSITPFITYQSSNTIYVLQLWDDRDDVVVFTIDTTTDTVSTSSLPGAFSSANFGTYFKQGNYYRLNHLLSEDSERMILVGNKGYLSIVFNSQPESPTEWTFNYEEKYTPAYTDAVIRNVQVGYWNTYIVMAREGSDTHKTTVYLVKVQNSDINSNWELIETYDYDAPYPNNMNPSADALVEVDFNNITNDPGDHHGIAYTRKDANGQNPQMIYDFGAVEGFLPDPSSGSSTGAYPGGGGAAANEETTTFSTSVSPLSTQTSEDTPFSFLDNKITAGIVTTGAGIMTATVAYLVWKKRGRNV